MAPLPIAIVMSSFEPGGTERQMIELARRLDRSTWHVEVACLRRGGAWIDRVAEVAPITPFPAPSFRHPSVVRHLSAFARWCRDRRIAIVHTTDMPSNVFALPAAAMAGVSIRVANRREIDPGRSASAIGLQRAVYGCAHRVVANCRAAADRLLAERVPARKVSVVPNGIDIAAFAPRSPRPAPRRVIVVSNLRPEKGHDVLIDAAADVVRRFPDATFEVVGGGAAHDRLVAQANARGVAHAFTFLGHRDDVPARLAEADIFVLPSRSEAFPNAVLEAMAAGLPIVASAVGGILEVVDDGRTGLLVQPDDPSALADRLTRVMADVPLAQRLGIAARAEVDARYSFDRMVAGFEDIYESELAKRGHLRARQPELAAS